MEKKGIIKKHINVVVKEGVGRREGANISGTERQHPFTVGWCSLLCDHAGRFRANNFVYIEERCAMI